MDNTCYYLGDTIWFAAYTRQTNTDKPSKVSRVLYAELWNHDGYLVERKLVEMHEGKGRGFFALYDTLYSGYFELRAYTRWQLNWGQTEHYHPWICEWHFYKTRMAKDYYRDYEKLYSRVFPVYDKPKQEGDFYKDMTFRPLRRYFSKAPSPPELRLSLFPEGGNLVADVPCRVAFEAATSEGEVREGTLWLQMKKEKVKIKNDRGEEVESVRTENRGRGSFTFTPVEGQSYEVVFQADNDSTKRGRVTQKIKDVQADGVSLQVHRDSLTNDWHLNISAIGQAARQPLGLTVMHEGKLVFFEQIDNGKWIMDNSDLPVGINQITVFDSIGRVYADRLFFVTSPALSKPAITVSGIKEQYKPFERIDLDVKGACPGTSVSLSVRDAVHQDYVFDSGNILTEMLLSSEIKGFVPQPEYFFEAEDEEHRRALDLLMMTQGWRRFNWQEEAVQGRFELTHPAELSPIVTGSVHKYHTRASIDVDLDQMNDQLEENGWKINRDFIYDEYNVLSKSSKDYAREKRSRRDRQKKRNVEYGNLKREVRVHAEFVQPYNQKSSQIGEVETTNGSFRLQIPNFYGDCLFYIDASDTTKWKRKWEGFRRKKKHQWIQMQDWEFERFPKDPEFYVRLNWPYPRFIKPYTYYQVHLARMRDTTYLSPRLLTDGTHLLDQVTVRARYSGLRRIDLSKPTYVMDAYEATNMAIDAGKLPTFVSSYYNNDETSLISRAIVNTLIGDMGMERSFKFAMYYDMIKVYENDPNKEERTWVNSTYPPPGEKRRWGRLEYLDKIYVYTDYSPRREGDVRYEQSNQPSVEVSLRQFGDGTRRVTYLNRRYVLKGFAYLEDFYHPDYQRNPPTEGKKDYRRTLYWNPDLQLDANGQAHITLYNNSQKTQICVETNGQAADGTLLHSGMVVR